MYKNYLKKTVINKHNLKACKKEKLKKLMKRIKMI